jgi:hypothetical protein
MEEIEKLKRQVWPMDLAFYARAAFRSRFTLSVDSAGGTFTAGWFPTRTQAMSAYRKRWKGRRYTIHDSFKSTRPELLKAFKRFVKLQGKKMI